MKPSKPFYKSKTMIANLAAAVGLLLTDYFGARLPVDDSTVAIGVAAVNLFLRGLTDAPVHVFPPKP